MKQNENGVSFTRREVLVGMSVTAGAAFASEASAQVRWSGKRSADVVVVGAGVFGAWTAWHLRKRGRRVTLLDAWGPSHARASSGGESRMTRTSYGDDLIYSKLAWQSLPEWKWLSDKAALPIFHQIGFLMMFPELNDYARQSIEAHRALDLPLRVLDRKQIASMVPVLNVEGLEIGLYEEHGGAIMARRAVQTLVREFVKEGGSYQRASVRAPTITEQGVLDTIETSAGRFTADAFVFACGPWLPKLFPNELEGRIRATRQEVFFFAPPAGDTRFAAVALPGWAEWSDHKVFYGFPDLEERGFKIANDQHGEVIDPDTSDRAHSQKALDEARAYMAKRFPDLAKAPLNEARVCQYENSSTGDFLVDRHPKMNNVWLVGAGSGHGFKHGPAMGQLVSNVVHGEAPSDQVRAKFSLSSKSVEHDRQVT